ncbi:AraC family transcriptional regulator, partial [Stenotrophomonas cyclobalanopsidis]
MEGLERAGLGQPALVAARERQRVLQARALLDARFGEEWPLERLAREVGLGEKRLQAGFRALVGTSVHGHLREVRLQAAGRMLHGGHSVTDTALAVGFSSLSHFSKAFRTQMGCTPRAWKRGESTGAES